MDKAGIALEPEDALRVEKRLIREKMIDGGAGLQHGPHRDQTGIGFALQAIEVKGRNASNFFAVLLGSLLEHAKR